MLKCWSSDVTAGHRCIMDRSYVHTIWHPGEIVGVVVKMDGKRAGGRVNREYIPEITDAIDTV